MGARSRVSMPKAWLCVFALRGNLFAPAVDRRRNTQTVAIFGDGAAGDLYIDRLEPRHYGVVGQNVVDALLVDHLLDLEAHGLGGMGGGAARRRDRGGEEVFEFEHAARRHHIFVRSDPRDRGFMHADRVGYGAQIERAQMLDAMGEESVL